MTRFLLRQIYIPLVISGLAISFFYRPTLFESLPNIYLHIHTHTHIYIYIYNDLNFYILQPCFLHNIFFGNKVAHSKCPAASVKAMNLPS